MLDERPQALRGIHRFLCFAGFLAQFSIEGTWTPLVVALSRWISCQNKFFFEKSVKKRLQTPIRKAFSSAPQKNESAGE